MHNTRLRVPQGGCINYPPDGRERACPDIVGCYPQGNGHRGFVADCKLYDVGTPISARDATKLQDDVIACRPTLVREHFITERRGVTGIFITITDAIRNVHPLRVIKINYDGGLGDRWEHNLQRKFREEMEDP